MSSHVFGRPYGVVATVIFSLLILLAYVATIFLTYMVAGIWQYMTIPGLTEGILTQNLSQDGNLIIYSSILASISSMLLVFYLCHRVNNYSVRDYLKFNLPTRSELFKWFGLFLLFFFAAEVSFNIMNETGGEEFINETMSLVENTLVAWFFIVVIAPFFEEVIFRGFLLEGLRYSRLGVTGAIVLTSLLWAVVHTQYNVFIMTWVFLFGILLGYARVRSNSLYLSVLLHVSNNLFSTLQVVA